MKVKDTSLKEVHRIAPGASINEAAAMMKRHGVGVLPVCEGGKLLGMLSDRDIVIGCVAAGMDAKTCQVREFMTSDPVTVDANADVEEAARIMGRAQVRRLPVIDNDTVVGLFSLGDLAVTVDDNALLADTLRRISTPSRATTS